MDIDEAEAAARRQYLEQKQVAYHSMLFLYRLIITTLHCYYKQDCYYKQVEKLNYFYVRQCLEQKRVTYHNILFFSSTWNDLLLLFLYRRKHLIHHCQSFQEELDLLLLLLLLLLLIYLESSDTPCMRSRPSS